ncbi:MAG: MoaD/ThiS family protein [Spongiibacter sp.]|uniref:Molybdopterin synthase sulfur carrier subunit n=1 Tax=Spongiibacter thalassae TaxID=2721624 RepID=A0ABX1GG34_9GAMM|nr:MoaD/ThiS family protein [Spongiibacter sp.]NKI17452.1 molybdopterin synthase sulfur carrier subunit [Spongiibacter thalassae]
MITVLFFARLREALDCRELRLDYAGDVAGLRGELARQKGEVWGEILGDDNIICAINQAVATDSAVVKAGDEVAFFPPVTGG